MNNLLFFNTEGYPYNFNWNSTTEQYEGKLLFEPNSAELFKTLGIYIFEEVDPIIFSNYFRLDKFEIYNTSGISFVPATSNGTITNIRRVNSAPLFYSKWIYGDNFDINYPKGTIISFSGITSTDFNADYYTVLDNKPGAILINSETTNSAWTYTYVSGGTIISHNIINYNDYDGSIFNYITGNTLYSGKKLNIVGSIYNDSCNSYVKDNLSGHTFYQSYIMSGQTNDVFKLQLTLYTERPKIYQGQVQFDFYSGTTTSITYLNFLDTNPSLFGIKEYDQLIFEDYSGNSLFTVNPIFTILNGTNEIDVYNNNISFISEINTNNTFQYHFSSNDLSSQNFVKNVTPEEFNNNKDFYITNYPSNFFVYDYYLEITGTTTSSLYTNDIIQLSAVGYTIEKNDNRNLTVLNVQSFYDIRVDYWKNEILNSPGWLLDVQNKAIENNVLFSYQLELDSIYMYDSYDNDITATTYYSLSARTNKIYVKEYIIPESGFTYNIKKLLKEYQIDEIECSTSPAQTVSSTLTSNVIAYGTSNIISFEQTILSSGSTPDYESTINAFNDQYGNILSNYGILVYYNSGLTTINIHSIYSLNVGENYFTPTLFINNNSSITNNTSITNSEVRKILIEVSGQTHTENIYPNNFSGFDKKYHAEILFDLSVNEISYGFNIELNNSNYYVDFSGDTQSTITNFISLYQTIFNNIGLSLSSSTDTLIIDADYNIDVNLLKVTVNMYSSYEIINDEKSHSIVLSGNAIVVTGNTVANFYNYGLSTGMILFVSGNTYPLNNNAYNIVGLTPSIIELSYQGPFFESDIEFLNLHTQRFLRKPRGSYDTDIYYNFKFVEPFSENIFFVDISGEHLVPYLNDDRLKYIGPKPLWDTTNVCSDVNKNIILKDNPNKNMSDISDPTKQQTVFRGIDGQYSLKFLLDQYDSSTNYNFTPEPLQVFLSYSDIEEGVSNTTINMDKVENVIFSGYTNSKTDLNGVDFSFDSNGLLSVTFDSGHSYQSKIFNFNNYGFDTGQYITIDFIDQKLTGQTIFPNYGTFKIVSCGGNKLQINKDLVDYTLIEFNTASGYTNTNNSFGFKYIITVQPKTILNIVLYGESEIEDTRLGVNLVNVGVNLEPNVESIFKESDINEQNIDYILLNAKRKEMLLNYTEIYNYLGSYKSLINAINFFGWNDLQVYEYYKNVNPNSVLYQKLQKVLIPDMFDNTISGWNPVDWVKGKYDTGYFKKTNLFNLTYKITDEYGNNTMIYSLDEVQQKLSKLKTWLKRNILPLSSNLVDITGVADVVCTNYQNYDVSNQIKKAIVMDNTTVVNFNFSETLNFQTNYLFEIDFYTINGFVPSGWTAKIKTFSKDSNNRLIPQKYYKLLKNDLDKFSFNIDLIIDKYIYIETCAYNDRGVAQIYNKMIDSSTSKHYILVNNNFTINNYQYLNIGTQYYFYDENGYIYLNN